MIGVSRAAVVGGVAALLWSVAGSQVPSHARLPLSSVVRGAVISLPFGCTSFVLEPYDPFCPGRHIHTGIDLAAATGTAVYSATAGTARVGFDPNGAGRYVVVTVDAHARVEDAILRADRCRGSEQHAHHEGCCRCAKPTERRRA